MITNTIFNGNEARAKILSGVRKVADAVTSTLGPGGRNVIIERQNGLSPTVTKDGVSVAKSIVLSDNFENMGAQMVIEVASKTNTACGDGTTTATLLASELYANAYRAVDMGFEPMTIKRGMTDALEDAKKLIGKQVVEVSSNDDLFNIATISANGDTEIGKMVSDIIVETGKDGIVVVQEGKNLETTWTVTKGVRLDSGLVSPYFANSPDGACKCSFADAYVLFFAKKMTNAPDLFPILQKVAREGSPIVVIAPDFDPDVISTAVVNRLRGTVQCCLVKAPGVMDSQKYDNMMDAATATGGTVVSDDLGIKLNEAELSHLGRAKRIDITLTSTTFIDGAADPEKFENRVNELRHMMESESVSDYQRHICRERLAKLAAGIAVVKVGGETQSIIHEKRDRIDDAICSTREARKGGIVAGAGSALLRAGFAVAGFISDELREAFGIESEERFGDADIGHEIVGTAMQSSFLKIVRNAGYCSDDGIRKYVVDTFNAVREDVDGGCSMRSGFDIRGMEFTDDLVKHGVIDPANVVTSALTNAVSVAALLISTDCMVGIDADSVPPMPLANAEV